MGVASSYEQCILGIWSFPTALLFVLLENVGLVENRVHSTKMTCFPVPARQAAGQV